MCDKHCVVIKCLENHHLNYIHPWVGMASEIRTDTASENSNSEILANSENCCSCTNVEEEI